VRGGGLTLRACDGGADIAVPPFVPTAFDGGRALEGIPHGPIEVVNLMGRRSRVRIGAALLDESATDMRIVADHALLYGFDEWVAFGHDLFLEPRWEFSPDGRETHTEATWVMNPNHAWWIAGANVRASVRRGRVLLATIDRQ
jgi:environmental stress-induced protein Ves